MSQFLWIRIRCHRSGSGLLWIRICEAQDQDQMSRLAELTGSAVVLAGAWRTWPCHQDFLWWLYYGLMIISGWFFDDLMINLTGLHINLPLLKSPAPPEVINPLLPFNFPASTSSSTWLCWWWHLWLSWCHWWMKSGWMSGLSTGGQSWGGQSWVNQLSELPTLAMTRFFTLSAWFRVVD